MMTPLPDRIETLAVRCSVPGLKPLMTGRLAPADLDRLRSALARAGVTAAVLDGDRLAGRAAAVAALAEAFAFPAHLSHNWDAAFDGLCELPDRPHCCVVAGAEDWRAADPRTAEMLVDVFRDAAARRAKAGGGPLRLVLA